MELGHWNFAGDPPTNPFGFIYIITNTATGVKYIGKKQCVKLMTRKPLKGKKRKRRDRVESDWKTYCGSSERLLNDISALGKEKFTFEIIRFCQNKWEMAYFEIKEQLDRDVLLREDYYNGIINVRIGKAPINTVFEG